MYRVQIFFQNATNHILRIDSACLFVWWVRIYITASIVKHIVVHNVLRLFETTLTKITFKMGKCLCIWHSIIWCFGEFMPCTGVVIRIFWWRRFFMKWFRFLNIKTSWLNEDVLQSQFFRFGFAFCACEKAILINFQSL